MTPGIDKAILIQEFENKHEKGFTAFYQFWLYEEAENFLKEKGVKASELSPRELLRNL
jgi:hypothetical protein